VAILSSKLPKINNITYKLWCKLPTLKLASALAAALESNPKMVQALQDSIVAYNRDDWEQRNLPALSIYYRKTMHKDNTWYSEGKIILKFHIPLSVTREREHEVGTILTEGTTILLQDYPFFSGILDQVPGLRRLGWTIDSDFKEIEGIVTKDVFTLPMEIDFAIDKLVWLNYINNEVGADALNPCLQIYGTIESFEIFVYPSIFPVPPS
jgi:hypothetical protein